MINTIKNLALITLASGVMGSPISAADDLASAALARQMAVAANPLLSSLAPEQRQEARAALAKLPRNSCPTRKNNRCAISGRSKAYYNKFGISRIALRELALRGQLPGVRKSSW